MHISKAQMERIEALGGSLESWEPCVFPGREDNAPPKATKIDTMV